MHAFNINDLEADCTYGYQAILNIPGAKINKRGILSNLPVYSPENDLAPQDKIMNLIDGETREGWLNFYLMRFSNDNCYLFTFGLNKGVGISDFCYAGDFQGYPDVLIKLTGNLNKAIEAEADELQRLYKLEDTEGIKRLATKIIHSIK